MGSQYEHRMNTIGFLLVTVAVATTAYPQIRTMVQKSDGTAKSSRIIGGKEVTPHSIPHQAYLTVTGTSTIWSCSGSIISNYYILTSARCVYGGVEIAVTVGSHNTSHPEPDQITYRTTNILIHPNYTDDSSYLNDISLVKTDFEIPFTYNIQAVTLPTEQDLIDSENFVGRVGRASGWGLTNGSNAESQSTVLRYVDGKILRNSDCTKTYEAFQDHSLLCVSAKGGICTGDVGGPLVADYKLVGISSFWFTLCVDGYPTGYTRVTSHIDWILQNSDAKIE